MLIYKDPNPTDPVKLMFKGMSIIGETIIDPELADKLAEALLRKHLYDPEFNPDELDEKNKKIFDKMMEKECNA